ncbi:mucin-4 isoform X2 [Phlebotomus papatasi]|uniref:mucin-4 isoform X2 n=1 Tax=Phlebotomus papatasi TaxID=29031 RepID=UPI002483E7B0|nr:mucin-4 isoform X2 [Phlebotomus papatasi]
MAAASAGAKSQGVQLASGGSGSGKGQLLQRQICHSQAQDPSPTWVRLITNGDIIYVSPSGEALKSLEQVKEYLLRPGTCKCGLPCPLRPDLYFNFDPKSQCQLDTVPRVPGACLHQARLRQEVDVKSYQGGMGFGDSKLSNLTLSRAPPWRKSVGQEFERVPPLHPQRDSQPPWQEEKRLQRTRSVAGGGSTSTKKRPNFKDDPTGYLDHQTAILHSSILNVHSPDLSQFDQEEVPEPQSTQMKVRGQGIVRQQVPHLIGDGQMMTIPGQKIVISEQIPGQTVTHLPNGMVQIHQNPGDGGLGKTSKLICAASQESPVSSSTAFYGAENSPSELRQPVQAGMITTSNDMPSSSSPELYPRAVASGHTVAKNTITSVLAGKAATTTCTTAPQFISSAPGQAMQQPQGYAGGQIQATNQLIMTSSGQFLVMPASQGAQTAPKVSTATGQMINPGNTLVINNAHPQILNGGSLLSGNIEIVNGQDVTQASRVIQGGQNLLPTGQNIISNAGNSFIVNSGNAGQVQSVILNNSNMMNTGGLSPATGKVIQNGGSVNQLINNGTMVLNTLPSGFVVQQPQGNFALHDGGVVDTSGGAWQQRTVLLSPSEVKRKVKKRKSMCSPQNVSPQISPQLQMVGASTIGQAPHYTTPQAPYLGSQLSQLTIVPAGKAPTSSTQAPQQQIIVHQNGQTILQPVNLIGQQLLVPAGLVVTPAPTETLLQIQNVSQNLLTQTQQMVLRAPSPQNKTAFLSPNSAGQQFIVSGNGQVSPLGQIYSTPGGGTVGLMVPQTSQNQTFVQQNTTIVQQQTTLLGSQNGAQKQSMDIEEQHQGIQGTSSPPDTTTYSPQSPDRPASERSVDSDSNMVQCVSSSEPDSVISPLVDGLETPLGHHAQQEFEARLRSGQQNFQQHQNVFKPSDAKVRRLQSSSIAIPVYRNPSKMKMSDLNGPQQ